MKNGGQEEEELAGSEDELTKEVEVQSSGEDVPSRTGWAKKADHCTRERMRRNSLNKWLRYGCRNAQASLGPGECAGRFEAVRGKNPLKRVPFRKMPEQCEEEDGVGRSVPAGAFWPGKVKALSRTCAGQRTSCCWGCGADGPQDHVDWRRRSGERRGKVEEKKRGGVRTHRPSPLKPVTREEPLLEVVKAEGKRKARQSHDPGQVRRGRGNCSRTRQGKEEEKRGGAAWKQGTGPLRPVTRETPLLEKVKVEKRRKEGQSQDPGQVRRGRCNCSRRRQGQEEEKNRGETGKTPGARKEGRSREPGQVRRGRGNCSRKEPLGGAGTEQRPCGNPRLMPVRARLWPAQEERKRRGGAKRVINPLTPVARERPPLEAVKLWRKERRSRGPGQVCQVRGNSSKMRQGKEEEKNRGAERGRAWASTAACVHREACGKRENSGCGSWKRRGLSPTRGQEVTIERGKARRNST